MMQGEVVSIPMCLAPQLYALFVTEMMGALPACGHQRHILAGRMCWQVEQTWFYAGLHLIRVRWLPAKLHHPRRCCVQLIVQRPEHGGEQRILLEAVPAPAHSREWPDELLPFRKLHAVARVPKQWC